MDTENTLRRKRREFARDMIGLTILLAITLPFAVQKYAPRQHPHALRVTFLDVGKGDAAVIETPSGKDVVIDTGGKLREGGDQGERVIAPFLRAHGKERITALILTHPHPDHIGGAAGLLTAFPTTALFDNGSGEEFPEVRRYRQIAQERRVAYRTMARGTLLSIGDGVNLRVLTPPRTAALGRINNFSIVIRLEYGKTAFLLTGDAEAESEEEMLANGQNVACNVLKVGHHGSRASTSQELLEAAHPQVAVISVNANNGAGYPHLELLDRLKAAGARVYRTDRQGDVTCVSDGEEIRVETER